jgi:hypothetical protein
MKKRGLLIGLLVLCLASFGIAAEKTFKATLSGSDEVVAVKTAARGEAAFELGKAGTELKYKLTVSDAENVAAAHVHQGAKGKNGPPLAVIDIKGKREGKFSGTLAEGVITDKELLGPMKGKSVKDLVKEIEAGNAYVNVHTAKYPDGEIRGQIK